MIGSCVKYDLYLFSNGWFEVLLNYFYIVVKVDSSILCECIYFYL